MTLVNVTSNGRKHALRSNNTVHSTQFAHASAKCIQCAMIQAATYPINAGCWGGNNHNRKSENGKKTERNDGNLKYE
eukprot:5683617-Amphidinium_carterae.1